MSQKSFTSHGHPIPGALYRPDQQPRNVARCGGPGLCPECSREAGHGNNKNRGDTIDHQQAAVDAVKERMTWKSLHWEDLCDDQIKAILTAATPHLRAAWAEEVRAIDIPEHRLHDQLPSDHWYAGQKAMRDEIVTLLEGGGACCEHSKCPGGSICCCQEGGGE